MSNRTNIRRKNRTWAMRPTRAIALFVSTGVSAKATQKLKESKMLNIYNLVPETPIAVHADAQAVIEFWRDAGPSKWFAKDAEFDRDFRERFLVVYDAAANGMLDFWLSTPESALALVILLDQFPRNVFRGTPHMYVSDERARYMASMAVAKGFDRLVEDSLALFFYLPFGHSENLADQDRAVTLCARLGEPAPSHSRRHRDIIKQFGRFPHRNPILGRRMKPEEQEYLDNGGYAG
jgi:uncharacterized protein (DUF924 family)